MSFDPHQPGRFGGSSKNPPQGPSAPFSHFPEHLQPRPPERSKWKLRFLILLLLVGIVGPCSAWFVPREAANWHFENARDARDDGDNDRAYAELTSALRWRPEDPRFYLQRAAWRIEDKDEKRALADIKALNDRPHEHHELLAVKAQLLQHLGRHAEAIATWKIIDRLSKTRGVPEPAQALNGLAYARAVGNREIKKALEDAAEALNLAPGSAAVLDTHAYLLHLNGEHDKALEELNQAVKGMEAELAEIQSLPPEAWRRMQMAAYAGIDLSGLTQPETGVAVVRYHRALVLKALDRQEEAQADLDRVRALIGREPDATLF